MKWLPFIWLGIGIFSAIAGIVYARICSGRRRVADEKRIIEILMEKAK